MPPPQPLEAGREGSRMAHQDDHFQIKVLRDPLAREGCDRIFDDQALVSSDRRNPVLQLILEKDFPRPPLDDFAEGFEDHCLGQGWCIGKPIFRKTVECVSPRLDVEWFMGHKAIVGERKHGGKPCRAGTVCTGYQYWFATFPGTHEDHPPVLAKKWRAALDVAPLRTGGSLTVMQRLVGAVYGLHLVKASPAIYVIHPVGVARVDQVVACAGIHFVVVFAWEDLVVAAATPEVVVASATPEVVGPAAALEMVVAATALEMVLPIPTREVVGPAETREAIVPVGAHERIVCAGAGEDLRLGFVPGQERSDHNYHGRQQDV